MYKGSLLYQLKTQKLNLRLRLTLVITDTDGNSNNNTNSELGRRRRGYSISLSLLKCNLYFSVNRGTSVKKGLLELVFQGLQWITSMR